jgi:hypothetical protein
MSHIEKLQIDIKQPKVLYPFRNWSYETTDSGDPPNGDVRGLFHTLTSLHSLIIIGTSRVAAISLDIRSSIPFPFCSTLRSLHLESRFEEIPDPMRLLASTSPAYYSALDSLIFRMPREEYMMSDFHIAPFEVAFPSSLTSIELNGPISSSTYMASILSALPALEALNLVDESEESLVCHLLRSIRHPLSVKKLSIFPVLDNSFVEPGTLTSLLSFVNVEDLYVDFVDTPEAYQIFSKLPLRRLKVRPRRPDSVSELVKLISGPTKIPTLNELEIAHLPLHRGCSITGSEEKPSNQLSPRWWGWHLPEWSRSLSREGFKHLSLVAEAENVEIVGELVGAIEIEEGWERELKKYRRRLRKMQDQRIPGLRSEF